MEMRLHLSCVPLYVCLQLEDNRCELSWSASKMSYTCIQYSDWVPQEQSKEHDEVD